MLQLTHYSNLLALLLPSSTQERGDNISLQYTATNTERLDKEAIGLISSDLDYDFDAKLAQLRVWHEETRNDSRVLHEMARQNLGPSYGISFGAHCFP